ncbi:MAG: hypothetical protein HY422_02455 [Candidatus Komeilibacteria bacterium]|nr:hypothetical protein [Candidatus Komeilibacteria bacterium]
MKTRHITVAEGVNIAPSVIEANQKRAQQLRAKFDHAVRLHKRAVSRVKRARTIEKKLKRRVNYYTRLMGVTQ